MQRKTHRDTRSKNLAKALEIIQEARRGNRTYEAKPIDVVALRGDRKPRGTARVLLQVIAHNPRAVLQALR